MAIKNFRTSFTVIFKDDFESALSKSTFVVVTVTGPWVFVVSNSGRAS